MKPLFILTVAPMFALACSHTDSQPKAETPQPAQQLAAPPLATEAPLAPSDSAPAPVDVKPPAPAATAAATATSAAATTGQRAVPTSASTPGAAPPLSATAVPAAAAAPAVVTPPVPQFRDITIPAGTSLSVTVLSHLGSATSNVEDAVKGALAKPVVISGLTALPQNTQITGVVTDAKTSGRVKGKASLALRFDRLSVRGETHQVHTARVILGAADKKSDDVKKGGVGAGLGAVVGGIAGGGKGAAIGAVAGGAGTVLGTKGKEVELPAGTVVEVLMQEPLTVRVPIKQ
jgi:hypothetical protein